MRATITWAGKGGWARQATASDSVIVGAGVYHEDARSCDLEIQEGLEKRRMKEDSLDYILILAQFLQ